MSDKAPTSENDLTILSDDIVKLLDDRKSEGEPTNVLRIYRAITGPITFGKFGFYQGVSTCSVKRNGFFNSNGSFAQYDNFMDEMETLSSYTFRRGISPNRKVDGLPVFLNPDEALYWLNNKQFEAPPIIGVLEVPLEEVSGDNINYIIVRNTSRANEDRELEPEDLRAHIIEPGRIKGECYLKSAKGLLIPEVVRQYETILKPNSLLEDGRIDPNKGFSIYE